MKLVASDPAHSELCQAITLLPGSVRALLASEWTRAAQFEHASIASFGRFALELLAFGAPPELVAGAHRAALDEVRHAQLCFTLASLYAGTTLGPGPLALDARAFDTFDLERSVRSAVIEGCVGETLAAVEASHVRDLTGHVYVRDVLSTLASDESEHAALAFRFVSWAVHHVGAPLRAAVRAAFGDARSRVRAREAPAGRECDALLAEHGRLTAGARHAVRARALTELIEPLAAELCQG